MARHAARKERLNAGRFAVASDGWKEKMCSWQQDTADWRAGDVVIALLSQIRHIKPRADVVVGAAGGLKSRG